MFNYYPPDYVAPGHERSSAPSSRCRTRARTSTASNVANTLAFGTIAPLATYPGATGTQPDWTALQAVAADANALADQLDTLLLHGTMPPAMRSGLVTAINAVAATDTLTRARTAVLSRRDVAEYQVER